MATASHPARILVVDDDPTVVSIVRLNLASDGYEIHAGSNGIEALQMAAGLRPDCILLDVMMPELDGLETCRRLKADPDLAPIPVILLTARADVEDKLAGFRLGADDYISKPFDVFELSARVKAVMSRASHAQLAAENGRLLQEARAREVEADALRQLATRIASLMDLGELLDGVARCAAELLRVEGATVRVPREGGLVIAGRGPGARPQPPALEPELARLALESGSAGAVDREGTVRLVARGRWPDQPVSALALPVAGTEIVGVLTVWTSAPREFGPRDRTLLEALGAQAAIAIENSLLLAETRRLSVTDALTGLANHRELIEHLESKLAVAVRDGTPLGILMLDIDGFKAINDSFGHPAGDVVLRCVGAAIQSSVRPADLVARYGGDEFMVVLDEVDAASVVAAGQRLASAVASMSLPGGLGARTLTLSIGAALFPEDAQDRESLVQAADQAMYFAKHEGGGRIRRINSSVREFERDPDRLHSLLRNANLATIAALAAAIEAKDPYTHGHTERVAQYAVAIGAEMGLPEDTLLRLRTGGLLHDIGKIGISDAILQKIEPLTEAEFEIIKTHSQIGYEMLRLVPFLEDELLIVLHHHERVDGKGYPQGLQGSAIPIGARIVLIADALDAMTSHRVYRRAVPIDEALERLRAGAGSQFDAEAVAATLRAAAGGRLRIGEAALRVAS